MEYSLDQDDSCHWYIVPHDKREAWRIWVELGDDPIIADDAPEWAIELGRHPSSVIFKEYRIK